MGTIVVDGRTDIDKLRELLATTTECSELDFKETLDLSKKGDELNFVKDAVSMFNRYPGGYIIVGATNEGEPSEIVEDIDWKQFDGARLTDKIRSYVNAPLTLISALHEIDGHRYCLICMPSINNGLPVPFAKLGQFRNDKGDLEVVFRPGDITRRDGAQNRPIEYLQWNEILARHDAVIREDESKRISLLDLD
ncbi:MAG: ATP-binding protein [Coriobacteriaceae bacterium]|nr:MAG: ATP-binding protein [Coriobacteriaceae bacterium]